jgi:Ca2+-transporting ATPase
LEQPPHDPRAPILTPMDFRHILREGAVMGVAALAGYFLSGGAAAAARASTVTFHGLTLVQLLHGIACRSETRGFGAEFRRPASPKLYGAIAASAALQVFAQAVPAARRLLGLSPIGFAELLGIGGIALGATAVNDAVGYLLRDHGTASGPPML